MRTGVHTCPHMPECGGLQVCETNLAAAIDLCLQPDTRSAPDVDGTHALGTIYLVPTDGHEVDAGLIHVHGDLAHCLCSICVEEHLSAAAQLAYLLDGLPHSCTGVYHVDMR